MISLIMFDLDGTLVDSGVDIANALNYAVRPYGLPEISVERTVSMIGEGINRLIEKVAGGRQAIVPLVLERFIEYYTEHLTDHTVPYPGVVSTLEKLAGYRKVVISNKREVLSKRLLRELNLADYFDIVLGSDSVAEKKPSPKPLFQILEAMSRRSSEAVIIGDSNYDVDAGKAAGVRTIAVTYGYRDRELLKNADVLVDRFDEIPSVLDRLNADGDSVPDVGGREDS